MSNDYGNPGARATDPLESLDAAEKAGSFAPHLEKLVVQCLRTHGPMTSHQIASNLEMPLVSISPRIKPLRERGLVVATGVRSEGRAVWGVPA